MREIKFRGKPLDYDPMTMPKWMTGFYHQELYGGRMLHLITDGATVFEVDPNTIGQYTGLCDKNGKEIYEGDIIHLNDEEFELEHGNGVVIFLDRDSSGNPCGGMWYVENADEGSNTETSLYDLHWEGALEVIGNRFDNPGLLNT